MKKSLITLATSIGLVLSMSLSAWAGFEDLLMIPPRSPSSFHFFTDSPNKPSPEDTEAPISISVVVIPNKTRGYRDTIRSNGAFQIAMTSRDTNEVVGLNVFTGGGDARRHSTSFKEFGMVKKVLEPGTMLFLGICLVGIGLFAIKFRK